MKPVQYEIDSKDKYTSRTALVALALAESEQRLANALGVIDRIQRVSDEGEETTLQGAWTAMAALVKFGEEGPVDWSTGPEVSMVSDQKPIHPAEKSVRATVVLAKKYRKERDEANATIMKLKAEISDLKKPREDGDPQQTVGTK